MQSRQRIATVTQCQNRSIYSQSWTKHQFETDLYTGRGGVGRGQEIFFISTRITVSFGELWVVFCVFTTDTSEWEAEEEGNVQVFIHHRSKAYGRGLYDTWKKCMHVSYSNFIEENQQINIARHLLWDTTVPQVFQEYNQRQEHTVPGYHHSGESPSPTW